jgi:hypothetical protein
MSWMKPKKFHATVKKSKAKTLGQKQKQVRFTSGNDILVAK